MTCSLRESCVAACVLMLGVASPARAQDAATFAFSPMNIDFMSGPIAFDNELVAGAPYSAEAVTESVQTLADGNRIVRESRAQINRDEKGRTRREQGLSMFGPLVGGPNGDHERRHVQITDPEARTTILLDLESRTAHRMPAPRFTLSGMTTAAQGGMNVEKTVKAEWSGVDVGHFEMAIPAPPPGSPGAGVAGVRMFSARTAMAGDTAMKPAVEELGSQFMEGVTAEGTRTTITIPAGQIGNELPIKVVSERWFSPELKVLVMSRQSDPRFGETTYRLTNITRAEPSPDLFEIPSDFKVLEPGGAGNGDVVFERKIITK